MAHIKTQLKILIVEDNIALRESIIDYFTSNHNVFSASNGLEALEQCKAHQYKFDLIITDLMMPVMDGTQFITQLRQAQLNIPVIIMTGDDVQFQKKRFRLDTQIQYISKPFMLKELDTIIDQLTSRSTSGFQGNVHGLGLVDIIQLYCLIRARIALTVTRQTDSGLEKGNIYFENGQITNAVCGDKRGEAAFYYVMSWNTGNFTIRHNIVAKQKQIQLSWEHLVMEALRLNDEQQQLLNVTALSAAIPSESHKIPDIQAFQFYFKDLVSTSEYITQIVLLDKHYTIIADSTEHNTAALTALIQQIIPFITQPDQKIVSNFTEIVLTGSKGLIILYPVEPFGFIMITSISPNMGSIRWYCQDIINFIHEHI